MPETTQTHQQMIEAQQALNRDFIRAARRNNYKTMIKLLSQGAEIESKDQDGMTALVWAAINGHREIVDFLLTHGADKETPNTVGSTPLRLAVLYNQPEIVTTLLNYGANIESRNDDGNTPLIRAAELGHLKVSDILLNHGAHIYAKDPAGRTALDWVNTQNEDAHIQQNRQQIAQHINTLKSRIESVVDDIYQEVVTDQPSSIAIEKEKINRVPSVLNRVEKKEEREAWLKHTQEDRNTLLEAFIQKRSALIESALNFSTQNIASALSEKYGLTIEQAIANAEAAKKLYREEKEHNRTFDPRNKKAEIRTGIDKKIGRGKKHTEYALPYEITSNIAKYLTPAEQKNMLDAFAVIDHYKLQDSSRTNQYIKPYSAKEDLLNQDLIQAISNHNIDQIALLVAQRANVNIQNHKGTTPLMIAAAYDRSETLAGTLVKAGAKPNTQDNNGQTALMHAVIYDRHETIATLLTHGADLNIQDKKGNNALAIATQQNNKETKKKKKNHQDKSLQKIGAAFSNNYINPEIEVIVPDRKRGRPPSPTHSDKKLRSSSR